ncbi:MAG: response regulator [Gemmatimonadetes bacterium]|nr:response regulator [Gemmatimonadota bacterium]
MAEILIVDDDQAVRDAFTRTLRHAGFTVTPAENGVAALQLLSQRGFDAIVSDYRMPELGGQGFYEQLEERFPALASRVVFVTAYADDPKIRTFLDQTGQPVLGKPVETRDLVDAVRQLSVRRRPSQPG